MPRTGSEDREKVLEKRMLQGDLIVAFLYIKGSYKKDEERLFLNSL